MESLELVGLPPLMARTRGTPEIVIGLIDGAVAVDHPELVTENLRWIGQSSGTSPRGSACRHGTFVAGVLVARRGGGAPAICPECTVLVRPIFIDAEDDDEQVPSATPQQLGDAIVDCVDAGATVLNISAGALYGSAGDEDELRAALDHAARHGALVVAAAGNHRTLGSTVITGHLWTVPVAAFGSDGRPTPRSNLGASIGRRGLGAPGENVTSLDAGGDLVARSGTSVAAAFVTGAIALLRSQFPHATASAIKSAVADGRRQRRTSVTPPLLDAWAAHQLLSAT